AISLFLRCRYCAPPTPPLLIVRFLIVVRAPPQEISSPSPSGLIRGMHTAHGHQTGLIRGVLAGSRSPNGFIRDPSAGSRSPNGFIRDPSAASTVTKRSNSDSGRLGRRRKRCLAGSIEGRHCWRNPYPTTIGCFPTRIDRRQCFGA